MDVLQKMKAIVSCKNILNLIKNKKRW